MPDASGTWLRRLDGTTWTNQLQLSTATSGTADVRAIGDVAHILLFRGTTSELASVEYLSGPNTYQFWTARPTLSSVSLDSGVETATIDVDSQDRMWLASDGTTTILVRYSDPPYGSWSGPILLATGVTTDDISVVTALPDGTVGVLWSNQNTQRFGFRLHTDGDDPVIWDVDEVPASQSALNVGGGMADDHLHVAVAADATLYAAVKTMYDIVGFPKIALLVRRPTGIWDDLYTVDESGTRGIALLSETAGTITVIYTSIEGAGSIVYKEAPISSIVLGPRTTLIGGSNHNDVTSTKQNIDDQVVLLARSTSSASVDGLLLSTPPAQCGDGVVAGGEQCDDGDTTPSDGCSATCQVETCFVCGGQPSVCTPNTGSPCNDGLFCNGADTCSSGACTGHAGDPCPGADGDGNCTESCNEAGDNCLAADPNGSSCTDALFCNGADTCSGGACTGHAGDPCPGADGDGNCAESCDEGADNCLAADLNGSSCTDALFCNGADTCSGGACTGHAGDPCPGADGDGNCAESCDEGADNCLAADLNGSVCTDGLFCTATDTCSGGSCVGAGDPCAGGTECNDACNEGNDDCAEAFGTPCTADGSVCTDDECDGAGTCGHPDNTDPCDDGLFCTLTDACSGGACLGAGDPCASGAECNDACNETADNCADASGTGCASDGNVCTDDECDGAGTCGHVNNTDSCDDGLFCTLTDACSGGACLGAGDPCASGAECNDACNETADNCADASGTGCASDGNVCTDDECDGASACGHPDNTDSCDDGLFCTATDTCSGGSCVGTGDPCVAGAECNDACSETANDCAEASGAGCTSDGNVCTDDECDGAGACGHLSNTDPCDDGLACTTVDACTAGSCVGSVPPECDDANPCTQDSCDDGSGCINAEEPVLTCLTAERGGFQVKDNADDAKDQLRWKWQKGEQTDQLDFGDPLNATSYTLCVYDTSGGSSSLATSLQVDANGFWQSYDPKGWSLKDSTGTYDGVQQIKLKPGAIGKSKAQLKARGANLATPVPVDASTFFAQDPNVTVQLLNSEGVCWTSEFTTNLLNTQEQFKAKTP